MPISPLIPRELRLFPFRGSDVVRREVLSWSALRGSSWRKILPDIYIRADVEMDHRLWSHAASLFVDKKGAVSGLSAALIWGINLLPRDQSAGGPVEVTVDERHRLTPSPQLTVVRSTLTPSDRTIHADVRVTTMERTAFDLARRRPVIDALIAVDAILHTRLIKPSALAEYAAARPRWRGVGQLGRVIELAEPGSESPMETRLRLILIEAGLPRPVAQHVVTGAGGRFVGRDMARLNAFAGAGWMVLRFAANSVLRYPDQIPPKVRALIPS